MTKNKVLIPIDGSQLSLQVLNHVTRFLSPAENELNLLFVAEEPSVVEVEQVGLDELTVYVDQAEASIRSSFSDKMLPQVRALEKMGFTVSTRVRFGNPIAEIEKCMEEETTDLIAMTTHGRSGLSRVMYGSVAEHVLHHATVPVLLYRTFDEPVVMNSKVSAKETAFLV